MDHCLLVNIVSAQVDRILIFFGWLDCLKKIWTFKVNFRPPVLMFQSRSNVVIVFSQPLDSFASQFFVLGFDWLQRNCSIVGKPCKVTIFSIVIREKIMFVTNLEVRVKPFLTQDRYLVPASCSVIGSFGHFLVFLKIYWFKGWDSQKFEDFKPCNVILFVFILWTDENWRFSQWR